MGKYRVLAAAVIALLSAWPAIGEAEAIDDADKAYIRSLAAPGKTVLVIEYSDGAGKVVERKGFASASGYKAVSPTDIKVNEKVRLHLYGMEPCQGDMVNRGENYSGSCAAYAERQLQIMLKSPKVIFCRAFVSEQNAAAQDATCYGYYNYPGSLDTIDMFEEQLVSLGALRLSKKADGTPMRPDLVAAEKIGRGGYGMWSDPRVKK